MSPPWHPFMLSQKDPHGYRYAHQYTPGLSSTSEGGKSSNLEKKKNYLFCKQIADLQLCDRIPKCKCVYVLMMAYSCVYM